MQQQKHNTIPGPGRRLTTGFGMLNKPINTIRNKAFSRASRHASSDTMGGEGVHTRQSESLKSLRQASKENKRSEKVARSQTMSFLPVPTKSSSRTVPLSTMPTLKPLTNVSSIPEYRVPTPPRASRPSYLPRSTTHPNLGVVNTGRRASEFSRRTLSRWPLRDDTRPLLRTPLIESPMLRTPISDGDWFEIKPDTLSEHPGEDYRVISPTNPNILWSALNSPRRASATSIGKENVGTPFPMMYESMSSSIRSPRVIQHRHLLQPIQPNTPPSNMISSSHEVSSIAPLTIFPYGKTSISPSRPVFANRKNVRRPAPLNLSPVLTRSIYMADTAQPNAYWSGRFMGLNDRLLNDSFDVTTRPINEDEVESSSGSTVSLPRTAQPSGKQSSESQRAKRIFKTLDETCTTDAARRSLLIFRNMYAIRMKMPELKCEIPPTPKVEEEIKEELLSSSIGYGGVSGGHRKMSFIERLRGRKASSRSILTLRD